MVHSCLFWRDIRPAIASYPNIGQLCSKSDDKWLFEFLFLTAFVRVVPKRLTYTVQFRNRSYSPLSPPLFPIHETLIQYLLFYLCRCYECNQAIGTDFKDLSYKGRHWHEECFKCWACQGKVLSNNRFNRNIICHVSLCDIWEFGF